MMGAPFFFAKGTEAAIVNSIGIPGQRGFGVGVCPEASLPAGMLPMPNYNVPGDPNYGNYQFADGSIMVWIPKFFYKIAATNHVDICGTETYDTEAAANAGGYALHRAFLDGGIEQPGFFVDKYKCSKNAWGAGLIASSIANGKALTPDSEEAHNPFSGLTGGVNAFYSAIDLAHRRDGVDGEVNASSIFFCCSRFIHAALALLSMSHGQHAQNDSWCAWYSSTYNYPKGCNASLGDYDDGSVLYEDDGLGEGCGRTGSGRPFAKTTHNGQECGVADLNGLMLEISTGATCVAAELAIEAMTAADPCQVTITGHGMTTGNYLMIANIEQEDWSGLNDKIFRATRVNDNDFTLDGASTLGFAAYNAADPGTVLRGLFYAAKLATAMKSFTAGNTEATDHWGATGIAALMDAINPTFLATGGVSVESLILFGSGDNQVLSEAVSGAGRLLTGLGLPQDEDAVSEEGTNLFGKDFYFQAIVNDCCLLSCAAWNNSSDAGVWFLGWGRDRGGSGSSAGFRAACYPV